MKKLLFIGLMLMGAGAFASNGNLKFEKNVQKSIIDRFFGNCTVNVYKDGKWVGSYEGIGTGPTASSAMNSACDNAYATARLSNPSMSLFPDVTFIK